jgi:phospholipid/cholesterol/gamma-HCH transport system permease protein
MPYIESRPDAGGRAILLTGEWTVSNAAEIETDLTAFLHRTNSVRLIVDASRIKKIDTAGAWLIRKHLGKADVQHLSRAQKALLDFLPDARRPPPREAKGNPVRNAFIRIGQGTSWSVDFIFAIFSFLGNVFIRLAQNLRQPVHFRIPSIVRHIQETGIQALPIIGLLAFGISMVISYQGAVQLRKFGADIYTIDLTVISLLREMAVLVTAIMVAGRSGSAFAAEIGVMKMRGEVDALRTMGMDPLETLVVPRLLALLITLPALAFFADIIGLAGGGFMSAVQLHISLPQYIDRIQGIATWRMFFVGMIKAPVFALLITAICTYQGMSATGSAENVGKLTTMAVVQSIFLVIMADAIFSVIFSKVDI